MKIEEIQKIEEVFFAQGCEQFKFSNCQGMRDAYLKATNAPGCSACARRRAKAKYREVLRAILKNLEKEDVFKNEEGLTPLPPRDPNQGYRGA